MSQRPTVVTTRSGEDFVATAAVYIEGALVQALGRSERVALALSGGTTPTPVYERLARDSRTRLDWSRIDIYFADERCVPARDPASNYGQLERSLLAHLGEARPRVFRMAGELDQHELAARQYEALLPERLDVLVLGLGEDGHTASLFPGSPACSERQRRALAVVGPKHPPHRLTLAPSMIQGAQSIFVLASGRAKSQALARALLGELDPCAQPVQLAWQGTWIVDDEAAYELRAVPKSNKSQEHAMTSMQLGMVGLGRMGANMVRRLTRAGHECVGYDLDAQNVDALAKEGIASVKTLEELVGALRPPRAVWIMVPAGGPTERTIESLKKLLNKGDVILDGGNSNYKDDVRRARELAPTGIHYVDVGTSGGVWGLERGYCLMLGGPKDIVRRLEPIFRSLAPGAGEIARTAGRSGTPSACELGYLHCGPAGAGHFVKMIHNGIEYGLMQAYAEGLDILRHANLEELPADQRYDFDLASITELWRRGSVVGSWLLDLTASALQQDPELEGMAGVVADSGEGRWTIHAAVEEAVPAPVLSAALYARFRSRRQPTFADKVLSAMRKGFGGHVEHAGKLR